MRNFIIILFLVATLTFFVDTITVLNDTEEVVELKKRHTKPFASQTGLPNSHYLPTEKVDFELKKYDNQFLDKDKYKL